MELIVSALLVVAGWLVGHVRSERRAFRARQEEHIQQYLLDSCRQLRMLFIVILLQTMKKIAV